MRDWCRFSGAGTAYIEPGSPWENPFVESFASRTSASTIVWIATAFREEHRQALDWLNENTGDNAHFLGIQLRVVKDRRLRPGAPLNVVAQPLSGYTHLRERHPRDLKRVQNLTQSAPLPVTPNDWQKQVPPRVRRRPRQLLSAKADRRVRTRISS